MPCQSDGRASGIPGTRRCRKYQTGSRKILENVNARFAPVCPPGGSWKGTKTTTAAPQPRHTRPTVRRQRPPRPRLPPVPRGAPQSRTRRGRCGSRDRYRYEGITGNGRHPSSGGSSEAPHLRRASSRRGDLTLRQEIEWNRRHTESEAVVLLKLGPKGSGCWALPERSLA